MFNLAGEKKWIRITLLLTTVIVLCANLFTVLKYGNYFLLGDIEKANNDDVRYIRTAIVLLEKGILIDNDVNKPTVAEMPGHALALALFMKLFGLWGGLTAFRVANAVLQASCIILVFLIARNAFNSTVGIMASIISTLYIPELSVTGLILMEVSFKFLFLLLVLITIYAIKEKQLRYYAWGGAVLAAACLFRPTVGMYPVIVLVMWLIYKYKLKEMIKYAVLTCIVFVIVMAPWWIRNYTVFDRFIPFTLSSGNPFLQGTYIDYDQKRDYVHYSSGKDAIETDKIETETGIYRLKTFFPKYPLEYIK